MRGSVNVVLDAAYGSSGKGKLSTWLADHMGYNHVSSANLPNAGHTAVMGDVKFVAKALPTAAILNRTDTRNRPMVLLLTPGSGFSWAQFVKEWEESHFPVVHIHNRAMVVTAEHARREREGTDSTLHLASTMQGSGAVLSDKIMRRQYASLVRSTDLEVVANEYLTKFDKPKTAEMFLDSVFVTSGQRFRDDMHGLLESDDLLHEGSQGYALSVDHGSHYPHCTSRNCTTTAALDYLGVAPQRLGDVWLNLRTYNIRVGNVAGGYSGDFYSDSQEVTWDEVADRAGMPDDEVAALIERERTTVTKRVRRVSTFSMNCLRDAVRTNGATKLCLNFAQYIRWSDRGVTKFNQLSPETRDRIDLIEDTVNIPVVLIGTGADHADMVVRSDYL
jgi:adenylosuccinate synthase